MTTVKRDDDNDTLQPESVKSDDEDDEEREDQKLPDISMIAGNH
jgi:hypothetical protein